MTNASDSNYWKYREAFLQRAAVYFQENKVALLRKQQIRKLNSGKIKKAMPRTLQKYGIVFNEDTKRYE